MHRARYISLLAVVILTLGSSLAFSQFRKGTGMPEEKPKGTLEAMSGGDSFFSRLFDPQYFTMHQTYSFSYLSMGSGSVGLTAFTNTFQFKPSDVLFISADVSAVYSPFSSF